MESTSTSASFSKLRSQPLDTSSVLYPTLTVHPPPVGHNILVLSLSHISSAPPTLSNDELFAIVLRRLEPWVGEEGEGGYVLVVLADENANGTSSLKGKEKRRLPGIAWWVWKWKRLPRKYRKNLKRLYVVHPSMFTRTLLPFIVPFVSPKSYAKLHPLPSLLSLYHIHAVPMKGIDVSLPVIEAEARMLRERPDLLPLVPPKNGFNAPPLRRGDSQTSLASWGYQTVSSAMGAAAAYLPFSPLNQERSEQSSKKTQADQRRGYWGRKAEDVLHDCGESIPPLLIEMRKVILRECINTEGVFRRNSNSSILPALVGILDLPIGQQPNLPWTDIAKDDPLLPPKILSRFFAELAEPLITPDLYEVIRNLNKPEDIRTRFLSSLQSPRSQLLSYMVHILHHLSLHSSTTKMTALNLSIVLAPVLISGPDPVEDTILCLEPSKPLPIGLKIMAEENGLKGGQGTLVGLLELWIKHYPFISGATLTKDEERCNCLWENGGSSLDERRASVVGKGGSRRHSLLASMVGGKGRSSMETSNSTEEYESPISRGNRDHWPQYHVPR
ncbi:uncharacterized protein IL334_000384 [Kwoniella shivajii]|uniref:Rho-GAP domain-containing protein n=1 Tax=Kwoniella shivajii TaxID=564305 RepID=A0ABZ1CQ22_9TREE|nr:hypothetical protein IL334_000384 [Kwoniella shivajii]